MNIKELGITPGPWSLPHLADDAVDCDCGYVFGSPESLTVATVHKNNPKDKYQSVYPDIEQAKANARIIATAPEMYIWIYGMLKCADDNDMIKAAKLLKLGHEVVEKASGKVWKELVDAE